MGSFSIRGRNRGLAKFWCTWVGLCWDVQRVWSLVALLVWPEPGLISSSDRRQPRLVGLSDSSRSAVVSVNAPLGRVSTHYGTVLHGPSLYEWNLVVSQDKHPKIGCMLFITVVCVFLKGFFITIILSIRKAVVSFSIQVFRVKYNYHRLYRFKITKSWICSIWLTQ